MADPRSGRQWQEGLSTLGHDNLAAEEEARTRRRQRQNQPPQPYTPPANQSTQPNPSTEVHDLEALLSATKRKLAIVATIAIVVIVIFVVGFFVLSTQS